MAATDNPSWARVHREGRAADSTARIVDALAGPVPPPRDGVSPEVGTGHLSTNTLAIRAALWGLLIGALAPATAALDLISGLAADGVKVTDTQDLTFFFGFVPLMMALITVLMSWVHSPLRDPAAYHRELFIGLLFVGVMALIELRTYGERVTSDEYKDAWLFVNGSLVLHALITYWLIRVANANLSELHISSASRARPAGLDDERLPPDGPRGAATAVFVLRWVLWGVLISTAAGAAAGTTVMPVVGTLAGAYMGAIYGLGPTLLAAIALAAVVLWCHDGDAGGVYRTVHDTLYAVAAVALVSLWMFLDSEPATVSEIRDGELWRVYLVMLAVVILMLRKAAAHLAVTYVRLIREQRVGRRQ